MAGIQVAVLCLLLAVQLQLVEPRALRIRSRIQGRVIGGSEASISDYPWTLALLYGGYQQCGASIIGTEWALTAAHCVSDYRAPYQALYTVRAGSSNRDSGGTVLDVAEVYEHEQHDSISGDYDIAVMRIDGSFPLGANISVVSLPEDGYDPPVGLAVTVAGWGFTETDDPLILQKVDISVRDRSACEFPSVGREVTPRMLCAGETGKSVCYGDSGSALVSGSTQVGIVSWGSGYCNLGGAVYVNVGNLRSWITGTTGI
ncbi:trypsin alpha-like [Schistocerca cancellata]|uniref:trypsin alpha-like n=1 Tax=Schistocerca cancellata TaxID=274614 RepID=UPI0021181CD4|nr:trypsin alpha-like [Schistocerca cancellata]